MADLNPKHKISTAPFLTGKATPEGNASSGNSKDNSSQLASEALGQVNKQLFSFVSDSLDKTLKGLMDSGTVEFEKLAQAVYSSVLEILNSKVADGTLAETLMDKVGLDGTSDDGVQGQIKTALQDTFAQFRKDKAEVFMLLAGSLEHIKKLQQLRQKTYDDQVNAEKENEQLWAEMEERTKSESKWYEKAFQTLTGGSSIKKQMASGGGGSSLTGKFSAGGACSYVVFIPIQQGAQGAQAQSKAQATATAAAATMSSAGLKSSEKKKSSSSSSSSSAKQGLGSRVKQVLSSGTRMVGTAIAKGAKWVAADMAQGLSKTAQGAASAIGKGVGAMGKSMEKIPYVGKVFGSVLGRLGKGIGSIGKAFGRMSNRLQRVKQKALNDIKKSFKDFKKAISKLGGGGISLKSRLRKMVTIYRKFGFKGVFTAIGRSIRKFTAKIRIGGMARKAMSKVKGLNKQLKLPTPKFNWKPRWGNASVKKQSLEIIKGMFDRAVGLMKGSTQTAWSWIGNIMNTICGGMTNLISTLATRISIISVVGLRGIFKALLSPAVLVPIGVSLLFIFRDQIFGWLKNFTISSIGAIFKTISRIGHTAWNTLKTAWSWLKPIGSWIARQMNPKIPWSIAWLLDSTAGWIYLKVMKTWRMIKYYFVKMFMSVGGFITGGGAAGAVLLGMAAGGWPWPMYGAMIYRGIALAVKGIIWTIKKTVRSYLGLVLCWVPGFIFRRIMNILGLDGVEPIWNAVKSSPKTLEDALTKQKDTNDTVVKLTANLSAANNINASLREVGLPDLDKFNKQVEQRSNESNEQLNKFTEFIKDAALVLTDPNKAPGISPTFYGSSEVTEALLSVFFFRDPMTGQIHSLIPKSNIPAVIQSIQDLVIEAAEQNDAHALAQANTDVLNYFDYMNRGRSTVLGNLLTKYQNFIDKLGKAEASEQRRIAKEFTEGMKNGDHLLSAMSAFTSDMRVKAGEDVHAEQQEINPSGNVGKGAVGSAGGMRLLGAGAKGAGEAIQKAKSAAPGQRMDALGAFTLSQKEITGKSAPTAAQQKAQADKAASWKKYLQDRQAAFAGGASREEVKKLGLGMDWKEWSAQYDKSHPPTPDVKIAAGSASSPAAQVKKKIELPQIKLSPPKQLVKISLPGLTRDVRENTNEFKLFKMGESASGKLKAEERKVKDAAYKKYLQERQELFKQGKTREEVKALGYGMDWREWSQKYDAEQEASKKKEEEAAKAQEAAEAAQDQQEVEADKQENKPAAEEDSPIPEIKMPEEFAPILEEADKLYNEVRMSFVGLDTLSIVKDMKLTKGDGSEEEIGEQEEEKGDSKWSFRSLFGKIKEKFETIKGSILGKSSKDDKEKEEKLKTVADMMTPEAAEESLSVQDNVSEQEMNYASQGISLVSEAQWVSATEAHKLEEKIIRNAKTVRDIIEGLTVMGDNLENAKVDLNQSILHLKKHPIVNVIPVQGPSQAEAIAKSAENTGSQTMVTENEEVFISGETQIYDPLPAI